MSQGPVLFISTGRVGKMPYGPFTPSVCVSLMDENAFYIKLYRKTQTQALGVNRPLGYNIFLFVGGCW